ncbi:MAG: hypothetical protein KGL39_46840 [Patescibacteria group bacterium]|nr:hypothetical protein [Patescibacteria group bacterium]
MRANKSCLGLWWLSVKEEDINRGLDLARVAILQRAPHDYPWFIRHFIRIEIKDVPGAIGTFQLWNFQVDALKTMLTDRRLIVLKARQLGLSWLVLAYAACRMLFQPGYRIAAISKTDKESMEMARRLKVILENMPEWVIREHKKPFKMWGGPTFEANTDRVLIHFPDKDGQRVADSIFTALPQSADSGRSLTGDLLILDEFAAQDYAEEIWAAAGPTINDGSGQAIIISTGKRNTKFEELCTAARKGEGRFKILFFPWNARPDRTIEWYENTKADFPNSYKAEYPCNEDEAFSAGAGRFFPEYTDEVHVLDWYPPKHWPRWGGYDPGFSSRACFKWYAIHPLGHYMVAYREYYPTKVVDEDQADTILKLSKYEDGSDEQLDIVLCDREAWNASSETETGQSTAEIFLSKGIPLVRAAKSKAALRNGWRRLHAFLKPIDGERPGVEEGGPDQPGKWSRLAFTRACSHSRRTYPSCVEANNDPEDISKQSEHHCFVGDTMVTTDHGPVPIRDVRVGDMVLTRVGYRAVLAAGMTNPDAQVVTVRFSNGAAVTGTDEHPLWTIDRGWTAIRDLREGDEVWALENERPCVAHILAVLYQDSEPVRVSRVQRQDGERPVYDLTVDDAHEFFANGVLVKNCQDVDRMVTMHYPLEIPGAPASTWDKEWGPEPGVERKKLEHELPFALQDDRNPDDDNEW